MTAFYENELMEEARTLAAEILSEINPELSVTENMIRSLQMRTTDLDAEAVVHDLRAGMDKFHEVYADANAQGLEAVISHNLDEILDQLAEEEQQALLMGILQTCAEAAGSEVPEGMDPELMKQNACHCLSEYSMVLTGSDVYLQLAELDEESLEAIAAASSANREEAYIALALYILKATGKVEGVKEELNPAQIGAMTAATLTALDAMVEAAEAETEDETEEEKKDRYAKLKKVLKIIAGVLSIVLIMGATGLVADLFISNIILAAANAMWGLKEAQIIMLLCICCSPVAVPIATALHSSIRVAKRTGITEALSNIFRKLVDYIMETVSANDRQVLTELDEAKVNAELETIPAVDAYTPAERTYTLADVEEDETHEDMEIF